MSEAHLLLKILEQILIPGAIDPSAKQTGEAGGRGEDGADGVVWERGKMWACESVPASHLCSATNWLGDCARSYHLSGP